MSSSALSAEPIGRVIGNYNSIDVLKNTKLVSGDKIIIPKRPTSISIVGEVLSPGSLLWEQKLTTKKYLEMAAGLTNNADKKRIYIIYPNGQAKKYTNFWSSNNNLLPGSTIVVPRRIELISGIEKISAITSVIYQLSLSLAGIDAILN